MEQSGQRTQWNEWGTRVQATLAQLLAPGPPPPAAEEPDGRPPKTWRKGDSNASGKAGSGVSSAAASDTALPRETIGWLQTALGATFQTFGTHVDQEFTRIDARMQKQQQDIREAAAAAHDAQARTTDLDHRMNDLNRRMQALEALPATQIDDCSKAEEAAQHAVAATARVQEELMNAQRHAEAILRCSGSVRAKPFAWCSMPSVS